MMKAVRPSKPMWVETASEGAIVYAGLPLAGVGGEHARGQGGRDVHGLPAARNQGPGAVSGPTLVPLEASRQRRHPTPQNAVLPPIVFPEGKNPYVERPLPPPPLPRTGASAAATVSISPPTMITRPSTSSGPGSNTANGTRPNFDKRLSKDDLALSGRMGMAREKRGLQPYITGVKGPGLLTPEPSPHWTRMPTPSPISSVPGRLPTPESWASGEIPIGMALGSPTQAASPYTRSPYRRGPDAGWKPQSQTPAQSYSSSPLTRQIPEPPVQRTKTQKRRLFGSLFGSRKHSEPAKTMEAVERNRSTASIPASAAKDDVAPARSNTVAGRKTPKHRPLIVRSRTESHLEAALSEPTTQQDPVPSLPTSGAGLLDVEIPDIRLERYSVMFSGVLNPNSNKSSLLERRQATLEKLRTANDRIEDEEAEDEARQRRASTPQPTKSPAFALFPAMPGRQPEPAAATTSTASSRGLLRSNTAPAHIPSPSRLNFESMPHQISSDKIPRREKKMVTIVSPRTMEERSRVEKVEKLREQQHQQAEQSRSQPHTKAANTTTTFHFGPEESALILDSPQSISSSSFVSEEEDDDVDNSQIEAHSRKETVRSVGLGLPLRPRLPEPQWQMVTPPSSTSSTSSATSKRSASSSATSTSGSSVTTRPSIDDFSVTPAEKQTSTTTATTAAATTTTTKTAAAPATRKIPPLDDEEDAALKAAVEISIARQISISRQQRTMLRPLAQRGVVMSSSSAPVGGVNGPNGRGRSATVGAGTGIINGSGNGLAAQEQVTVGIVKGRVVETRLTAGGAAGGAAGGLGGNGIRRSERVVLDVVE